ncbi:hypothetical protein [Nonomuraea sp. NPDC048901]|uniref:hypothetical protein n=1 Tax=unclassified Nonomuraea TaxID=2593643 RepID=UPI0033DC425B
MTKKIISTGIGIVLGAAALVGVNASPAAAALSCSKTASTDHSVSVKCTGGLGTYFRAYGYFCSTSNCQWQPGNLVRMGGTSKATSNGYYSGEWDRHQCDKADEC